MPRGSWLRNIQRFWPIQSNGRNKEIVQGALKLDQGVLELGGLSVLTSAKRSATGSTTGDSCAEVAAKRQTPWE
ncbi:MAG: hypothetical protein H7Z43_04115 [Clostridia bacterium]|nr:hypothetical protein [Deltaproteobacteria bacterium]